MRSTTIIKAPALAMVAALGVSVLAADAGAQLPQEQEEERQQQRQQERAQGEQCRAILSPSTLTAPSQQMQEEERRQQRVAGKMTLQARLTEDIGKVSEVEIEEGANIDVSVAEEEQRGQAQQEEQRPRQDDPLTPERERTQQEEAQQEQEEAQQQQEQEQQAQERQQQRRAEHAQNRVPLEVDVSEAQEGEWKVTFKGENDRECTGTLRVRGSGPAD